MSSEEFNTNSQSAQSESLKSQVELQSEVNAAPGLASQVQNPEAGWAQSSDSTGQVPVSQEGPANPQILQNSSQAVPQAGQVLPNQPQPAGLANSGEAGFQTTTPGQVAPNQAFYNGQPTNQAGLVNQGNQGAVNGMPAQNYQTPNMTNPKMAANGFAQAPYMQPSQAKSGMVKKIIWSIVGGVAAVFLIIGSVLLYRHFSGNVDGTYQATTLQSSLKKDLKDKTFDKRTIAYSSFTDNVKVETVIKGDVVKASVTYDVSYDDFYDEVKSNLSSTYSTYKSSFSNDEWNYLLDTLIKRSDLDEKGFTKTLSSEVEDDGLSYDSDKNQASGTLFEGKVNRVSGKIEITKVNSDSKLVNFEKGQKISYKKTSNGLTLKDNNEHTINLTTE